MEASARSISRCSRCSAGCRMRWCMCTKRSHRWPRAGAIASRSISSIRSPRTRACSAVATARRSRARSLFFCVDRVVLTERRHGRLATGAAALLVRDLVVGAGERDGVDVVGGDRVRRAVDRQRAGVLDRQRVVAAVHGDVLARTLERVHTVAVGDRDRRVLRAVPRHQQHNREHQVGRCERRERTGREDGDEDAGHFMSFGTVILLFVPGFDDEPGAFFNVTEFPLPGTSRAAVLFAVTLLVLPFTLNIAVVSSVTSLELPLIEIALHAPLNVYLPAFASIETTPSFAQSPDPPWPSE